MSWWLTTALLLSTGAGAPIDPDLLAPQSSVEVERRWQLAMSVLAPLTTTDPNHIGTAFGVGRQGRIRAGARYQPSESDLRGFIHATLGLTLRESASARLAADFEYSHVWASRRLFQTRAFQFEGHDRRQVYLGVVSLQRTDGRRWWGLVDGVEIGAGRMHVRDLVAGRVGGTVLNPDPVAVLKSVAPVGMVGATLSRPLPLGLDGSARLRVFGAGHSRGGVVPFAQASVEWEVVRQVFSSPRYGRGALGLAGTHATHTRSPLYFQNGVGLTLKIAF